MGKFVYKDDQEVEHDITLGQISSKNIKSGDIIVVYYEVGDASVQDASYALTRLRELVMMNTPEDVKVMALATRNGKKDIEIKIVKDKTNGE